MAKATSSTDDVASLKPGIGELTQELAQARAELDEGHLREAATAELLKVISRTKFELQPVLDTVGENAARLCDANNAVIYRLLPPAGHQVASYGQLKGALAHTCDGAAVL